MAIVDKPWVPIRTDLEHDPRVIAIARACEKSLTIVQPEYRKHVVCWGLKLVWSYFVTHSIDGVVDGLTAEDIDAIAGVPGLALAMAAPRRNESPWLILNTDGATIPDFGKWHWKTLRKTEQNAQRQRDFKQRSRSGNAQGNAPGNATERYQNVTAVYTNTQTKTKKESPPPPVAEAESEAERIEPFRIVQRVLREAGVEPDVADRLSAKVRLTPDVARGLAAKCAGVRPDNPTGWFITQLRELGIVPKGRVA